MGIQLSKGFVYVVASEGSYVFCLLRAEVRTNLPADVCDVISFLSDVVVYRDV